MVINNCYGPIDQTLLINELIQGMELTRQLRTQLGSEFSTQTNQILLQQIISSYDRALNILGWGSPAKKPRQLTPVTSPRMPSSPSSYIGTPKGNECSLKRSYKELEKKNSCRKSASTWTKHVKLSSENGINDGYSWRKYGQKDILGAKHPRSYYRCTYRNAQDCWATRQVQRSEDDPTVFDITYRGKHTCNVVGQSKSESSSPRKQEPKQEEQDYDMISSFVDELADVQNMDSLYGDFGRSDMNYFSVSSSDMDILANAQNQQQYLDGGLADVVLGATSSIFSHHHL
ncbi:hypothetical protein V2J09_020208 [Rumex salicifolius]